MACKELLTKTVLQKDQQTFTQTYTYTVVDVFAIEFSTLDNFSITTTITSSNTVDVTVDFETVILYKDSLGVHQLLVNTESHTKTVTFPQTIDYPQQADVLLCNISSTATRVNSTTIQIVVSFDIHTKVALQEQVNVELCQTP